MIADPDGVAMRHRRFLAERVLLALDRAFAADGDATMDIDAFAGSLNLSHDELWSALRTLELEGFVVLSSETEGPQLALTPKGVRRCRRRIRR